MPASKAYPDQQKNKNSVHDLRVKKTRKALIEAFIELSETRTPEDITVGDICEKAMVRRATFYNHFADKYEFFEYVMDKIQRDTNVELNAHPGDITMAEYCVNICRAYLRNYKRHPKMVARLMNSKTRSYSDLLIKQATDAIRLKAKVDQERGIKTEIDAQVLATFIGGAIPNTLTRYQKGDMKGLDEESYLGQLQLIFDRICNSISMENQPE